MDDNSIIVLGVILTSGGFVLRVVWNLVVVKLTGNKLYDGIECEEEDEVHGKTGYIW